jgi:hypothetical protein
VERKEKSKGGWVRVRRNLYFLRQQPEEKCGKVVVVPHPVSTRSTNRAVPVLRGLMLRAEREKGAGAAPFGQTRDPVGGDSHFLARNGMKHSVDYEPISDLYSEFVDTRRLVEVVVAPRVVMVSSLARALTSRVELTCASGRRRAVDATALSAGSERLPSAW